MGSGRPEKVPVPLESALEQGPPSELTDMLDLLSKDKIPKTKTLCKEM